MTRKQRLGLVAMLSVIVMVLVSLAFQIERGHGIITPATSIIFGLLFAGGAVYFVSGD